MKKILILSLSIIISCTQYPNEVKQTPSVQVSSNNSNNQNNIQKINSLEDITNEMRYKYIKDNLELHHCHKDSFYLSYYDPFGMPNINIYRDCIGREKYEKRPYSKIYSEYEKLVKNSKNFEEVKDINNFMKDYDCQPFSFKCFYCESEENFLKNNIDFDLSQVGKFYISKDVQKIYVMTNNQNMDKTYQYFQNAEKDNLDYIYDSDFKKSISVNDDGTIKRKALYIIDDKNNIETLKIDNKLPFSCNLYDFYYDGENNIFLKYISEQDTGDPYDYKLYHKRDNINIYYYRYKPFYNSKILTINNNQKILSLVGLDLSNITSNKILFLSNEISSLSAPILSTFIYYIRCKGSQEIKSLLIGNEIYINISPYSLLEGYFSNFDETRELVEIDFSLEKNKVVSRKYKKGVIVENYLVKEITDMKANSKGEIIILDNPSNAIWRVVPFKSIEKLAGKRVNYTNGDKNMLDFINPAFIDIDKDDNIYVLDKGRKEILKIHDDRKNEINKDYSVFYKQVGDKIKVKY